MRQFILGLIVLLGFSTVGFSRSIDFTNVPRVDIIGTVGPGMPDKAKELLEVTANSQRVVILVNSPGGSVDLGNIFIQAIDQVRARGVRVDCVSGVLAASMGFQILAHCTNIYTLRETLLLFHPAAVRTTESLNSSMLGYYKSRLDIIERRMIEDLQNRFHFPARWFHYHYTKETLHTAYDLSNKTGQVQILEDIKGLDDKLYVWREESFFDMLKDKTELIYIAPTRLLNSIK